MNKSESIVNLTKALIKAKAKFNPILRENENPAFKKDGKASKYADLRTVIEATEPALLENGIIIIQFPHNENERTGVQTLLIHESGEFLEDVFTLPIVKQDAQTVVGAVTYARRCSWKSILGVSEEDDDGNAAAGKETSARPAYAPKIYQAAPIQSASPQAAVKPPKANIPTAAQPSEESVTVKTALPSAGSSDALPAETELKELRARFGNLVDALQKAGLKSERGKPIQRKVLAYLLKTTGAAKAEAITKNQWETFFKVVNATVFSEGGQATLIEAVNQANQTNQKEEK